MRMLERKTRRKAVLIVCALLLGLGSAGAPAFSQTIVDEWNAVKIPPAPELKAVKIDPKVTVLLLDFNKQTCNPDRRPRCIASIPKVEKLAKEAGTEALP